MKLRAASIFACATLAVVAGALAAAIGATGATSATRTIVFSAHPDGATISQLFSISSTGAGLKQLTKGSLPAISPAFSRSGTKIAFSRLGSGIFVMSPNGSGVKRLTSNGRDSYPVWSPDGTRIAFIRIVGAQWRLFVMSADGKHQRRLGLAPPAGRPNWTLDGKAILIPAGADLVKVDAVTGRPLTYYGIALDVQTGQTATVSPDGRQLAFVGPRVSTGPPDCGEGRCPQFGLYLASVRAPHRVHRVVNDTGAAGWSPDGKTLAYVSKGTLTLRVLASGVETKLPTDAHQADGDAPPAWSPR